MKKFLLVLPILLLLASCKYEDGPKFSLRTKTHRAVNVWHIDRVLEDGVDKTENYKNAFVNYSINLKDDHNYELKYRPFNLGDYKETGKWEFSGDKGFINFAPEAGNNNSSKWKILKLKETETWVIQNIDGKDVELRMKD